MGDAATIVEPGWHPDPLGRHDWRYWDGGWTSRVADSRPRRDAPPSYEPGALPAPIAGARPPDGRSGRSAEQYAAPPVPPVTRADDGWASTESSLLLAPPPAPVKVRPERRNREQPRRPVESLIVGERPGSYAGAMLVVVAAFGIGVGASLPWVSGSLNFVTFRQTGFDSGDGWYFVYGAVVLGVAALLAGQLRPARLLPLALSLTLAGFVIHEILKTNDLVSTINRGANGRLDVGVGLWLMAGSALIAAIESLRLARD